MRLLRQASGLVQIALPMQQQENGLLLLKSKMTEKSPSGRNAEKGTEISKKWAGQANISVRQQRKRIVS